MLNRTGGWMNVIEQATVGTDVHYLYAQHEYGMLTGCVMTMPRFREQKSLYVMRDPKALAPLIYQRYLSSSCFSPSELF